MDTMLASELISKLKFKEVENFTDFEVALVTQDTREVVADSIFIAIAGHTVDGHAFVDQALQSGAKLIIAQKILSATTSLVS